MRPLFLVLCGLALAGTVQTARADVRVTFTNPQTYADAGHAGGALSRGYVMSSLRDHLVRLGRQYLRPGQTLSINVRDIDLAGVEKLMRSGRMLRFDVPVTWPHIRLSYALSDGKRVVARGEETVSNQMYQSTPNFSSDPLRYEKAMLSDWFFARFAGNRG